MNKIRLLLLPLSWVYGVLLWLRNILYNKGFFSTYNPKIKTIVLGNLSLGGTGKTPHAAYILSQLDNMRTGLLSRGYGRLSRGTFLVKADSHVNDTGDEPLQLARKFPKTTVIVDEARVSGIKYFENQPTPPDLVLLDDALQHRKISGGLNVLLTTWREPFYSDHYLPAGNLRDARIRAKNADVIVITKSPETRQPQREKEIRQKLAHLGKPVFFSKTVYGEILPLTPTGDHQMVHFTKVLLVTGIANPTYFVEKVATRFHIEAHYAYRDHHQFTHSDLQRFRKFIGSFAAGQIAILTTEKDAMRIMPFAQDENLRNLPIFYWEITVDMGEDQNEFTKLITNYANKP